MIYKLSLNILKYLAKILKVIDAFPIIIIHKDERMTV